MSKRLSLVFLVTAWALGAQPRTLTLKQAVALAAERNADVLLAGLEERKAREAVRVARDPFLPKIAGGSGLAYSNGFPLSIEGSAPSIFQAQAVQFVFNRPQKFRVDQARETARGAALEVAAQREDAAHRAAVLFLEAERVSRLLESTRRQVESLERAGEITRLRVSEGRELPIEANRAALNLARARQRLASLEAERAYRVGLLATVLGLDPDEPLDLIAEDRKPWPLPDSEQAAVQAALDHSLELRRLESSLRAKNYEIRSHQAERLPRVDLVAQYSVLGRFNNYEDFFRKFQRHNGQIGFAFQIPAFRGSASSALEAQAAADAARVRIELERSRRRIMVETRRLWQLVREAHAAREVARLDLEVARANLSLLLAQMNEGRASLRQVEEARFAEHEKWIALFDSQYALERAQLDLLRQTGELLAVLR
jgi:outer membrane protein